MESEQNPRTARDALIIELMGDIGVLHDEIKRLPVSLKGSLSESLKLIADAVEESEKTAQQLKDETALAIKSSYETHIHNMEKETKIFLQESVMKVLNDEIAKTSELTQRIRNTLNNLPDSLRPETPIWPIATLSAAVMAAIIVCGFFGWKMYQQNAELYKDAIRVYKTYEEQQKVIQTLPPEYRKKFTLE